MFDFLRVFTKKDNSFPKSIILNSLGKDIEVKIRYSNKAKRISIRIVAQLVQLVIPNNDYYSGYKFLLEKESWIRKKLATKNLEPDVDQNIIPIFGEQYFIHYLCVNSKSIEIKEQNIYVYASNEKIQKNILIDFLVEKLFAEIKNIILPLSTKYKISFSMIRIMNNKTRWGACSSEGKLSFNWRLIFTPKDVIKYLIVHELSHIVHMNHSQQFWNLVEEIYPEYKIPKNWLKKNGYILHKYLN